VCVTLQSGAEHRMNLVQHSSKMQKGSCFLICHIVTYCVLITDLSSAKREGKRSMTWLFPCGFTNFGISI